MRLKNPDSIETHLNLYSENNRLARLRKPITRADFLKASQKTKNETELKNLKQKFKAINQARKKSERGWLKIQKL